MIHPYHLGCPWSLNTWIVTNVSSKMQKVCVPFKRLNVFWNRQKSCLAWSWTSQKVSPAISVHLKCKIKENIMCYSEVESSMFIRLFVQKSRDEISKEWNFFELVWSHFLEPGTWSTLCFRHFFHMFHVYSNLSYTHLSFVAGVACLASLSLKVTLDKINNFTMA